ncbi:hypothetical protein [Cetobacterium ceti]
MTYEDNLRKSLSKIWEEERIEKFLKLLEDNLPIYKGETLVYFIDSILEKEPQISEYKILEYTNRMDAFCTPYEFLEDLFSQSKESSIINLLTSIKNDNEKINQIINQLVTNRSIEIYEKENEFYVFIK